MTPGNDNAAPRSSAPELPRRDGDDIPVVNTTHYETGTLSWQLQPPQDALVVVVKGTFDMATEGPVTAAAESDYPVGELNYDDDRNSETLRRVKDVVTRDGDGWKGKLYLFGYELFEFTLTRQEPAS